MHWSSWQAFWDMGGYALYVWGSFGVTFLLMALEVWQARASWREELANLTDAIHIDDSLQKTPVHPRPGATLTLVSAPKASTEQGVQTP
jgi:heme exporter protein D